MFGVGLQVGSSSRSPLKPEKSSVSKSTKIKPNGMIRVSYVDLPPTNMAPETGFLEEEEMEICQDASVRSHARASFVVPLQTGPRNLKKHNNFKPNGIRHSGLLCPNEFCEGISSPTLQATHATAAAPRLRGSSAVRRRQVTQRRRCRGSSTSSAAKPKTCLYYCVCLFFFCFFFCIIVTINIITIMFIIIIVIIIIQINVNL